MNKYDKFVQKAFDKMFDVIGMKFDEEFVRQEDWYQQKTWTSEQEQDFKKWFIQEAKKDLKFNKTMAEREHAWFNLKWGWKTAA